MRFVKGFFTFWYDFIVGDDWRIAVVVIAALAVGAVLVATEALASEVIAILFFLAVLVSLIVSLRVEAARARRG